MIIFAKDLSLHLLSVIPILALGAINTMLLIGEDPVSFQRFGSIAVVVGVVLFGLTSKRILQELDRDTATDVEPNSLSKSLKHFHAKELAAAEMFLIVVGTIQWGYGDLFHCLYHGKGWTTC